MSERSCRGIQIIKNIKRPLMLLNILASAALLLWSGRNIDKKAWQGLTWEEALTVETLTEDRENQSKSRETQIIGEVDYLWIEDTIEVRLLTEEHGQLLVELSQKESTIPKIGNQIQVRGQIREFRDATVPGQYEEQKYRSAQGYTAVLTAEEWQIVSFSEKVWHQWLWELQQAIRQVYVSLLPEKEAGIFTAMILGNKQFLDPEVNRLYQENGIAHLLSVSGLHVILLGGAVYSLFRRVTGGPAGRLAAGCVAIFFLFSYGILIDYPISTKRAVFMMVLQILAGMAGRTYDLPTALSCAAVMILFQEPEQAWQPGFQLSFSAILGILLLRPMLGQYRRKRRSVVEESAQVGLATFLMTLPLQMLHFYQISFSGLWNNLMVIPCMPLVLLSGLFGGVLGLLPGVAGEMLGRFSFGSGYMILKFYEGLCRLGEHFSWAVQITGRPGKWQVVLYYGILIVVLLWWKVSDEKGSIASEKNGDIWWGTSEFRRWLLQLLCLIGAVVMIWARFPVSSLTLLDVGQGDGIVIRDRSGAAFMVDCGSSSVTGIGNWRLLPYLKQEGIRELEGIFISHTDEDHISGIQELLEEETIKIKQVFFSDIYRVQPQYQTENYWALVNAAENQGVEIYHLKPGEKVQMGNLCFCCMLPEPAGHYADVNEASLILSLEMEGSRILLTGDMGEASEHLLLEKEMGNYDLLKVAHHGSRYSSSEEFLRWCQPDVALISCSEYNVYGHPDPEVLSRLSAEECRVYSTSISGTIRVTWKRNGEMCLWHWE